MSQTDLNPLPLHSPSFPSSPEEIIVWKSVAIIPHVYFYYIQYQVMCNTWRYVLYCEPQRYNESCIPKGASQEDRHIERARVWEGSFAEVSLVRYILLTCIHLRGKGRVNPSLLQAQREGASTEELASSKHMPRSLRSEEPPGKNVLILAPGGRAKRGHTDF